MFCTSLTTFLPILRLLQEICKSKSYIPGMAKSFLEFLHTLNEAPPAAPMGGSTGGGPLGGAPGAPPGGGLPPPPMGGGGMGGGMPPPPMGMGGGDAGGGQQPVPVKTIDAMDVWSILKHAVKDMDKHEELNIHYERKQAHKKTGKHQNLGKLSLAG